jgi:hypothetical protein
MKTLTLTKGQADVLRQHLFPADGYEAVALLLCGRRSGSVVRHLVQRVVPIPYSECSERTPTSVRWSSRTLRDVLETASRAGLSVFKVHSHRNGLDEFSATDDTADEAFFSNARVWVDRPIAHGSVVLMGDGRLFGRCIGADGAVEPLERIMVVGPDVRIHFWDRQVPATPEALRRNAQAFGSRTVNLLKKLSVAVIGCSGTGSPAIEQLFRLGVGRLVLVEPEAVGVENLNRILHATAADAAAKRPKVDVIGDAIERAGVGTTVVRICHPLSTRRAVEAVAACDFAFGCMDGAEGRSVLNRLATYYLLPYLDLGVKLEADEQTGVIKEVSGAVHYLQPGLSTLMDRRVITPEDVQSEALRRIDPDEHARREQERYIKGAKESSPAVISVNFQVAAMAVNDFLARLHDYRTDGNDPFAEWRVNLCHVEFYTAPERDGAGYLAKCVGQGDVEPYLGMPELSR